MTPRLCSLALQRRGQPPAAAAGGASLQLQMAKVVGLLLAGLLPKLPSPASTVHSLLPAPAGSALTRVGWDALLAGIGQGISQRAASAAGAGVVEHAGGAVLQAGGGAGGVISCPELRFCSRGGGAHKQGSQMLRMQRGQAAKGHSTAMPRSISATQPPARAAAPPALTMMYCADRAAVAVALAPLWIMSFDSRAAATAKAYEEAHSAWNATWGSTCWGGGEEQGTGS